MTNTDIPVIAPLNPPRRILLGPGPSPVDDRVLRVMSAPLVADVVIVGSGIAGAITAARLARGGVKVLVLEAGPRVDRAQAATSSIVLLVSGRNGKTG